MPSRQGNGKKSGAVYFWKPEKGHGWLGQWYWSPWTWNGESYNSAEMWMMVAKARIFGDEDTAQRILATSKPRKQKALGRTVKGFDDKVWDAHKLRIVEEGNYHKFTISEDADNLKAMLLATGDRELVEASAMDRVWGIGFSESDAEQNRVMWGQNLLGKALMNVRERLMEENDRVVGEEGAGEEANE